MFALSRLGRDLKLTCHMRHFNKFFKDFPHRINRDLSLPVSLYTGDSISFLVDHFWVLSQPPASSVYHQLLSASWTGSNTTTQCFSLSHPDPQEIVAGLKWLPKLQPLRHFLALQISKTWINHTSIHLYTNLKNQILSEIALTALSFALRLHISRTISFETVWLNFNLQIMEMHQNLM